MIRKIIATIFNAILSRINPIKHARHLGVHLGDNCRIVGRVTYSTEPYLISIGNHVSITNSSFITHDGGVWVFREENPDVDLFGKITIGNNVFIGSGVTILPNTNIGNNVIIGAGAIVKGNIKSNSVYAGVPARFIKTISEYKDHISGDFHHTKNLHHQDKKAYLQKEFYGL